MKTEIYTNETGNAAQILRNGGLVAVPTETVYGLAANGLDSEAVAKIYAVKGRPENKALALMISSDSDPATYCAVVPRQGKTLIKKFWPGPLTIILEAGPEIPGIVTAGGHTVGLRCPAHELTQQLLREAKIPLAAPSANPSGEPAPNSCEKVLDYFNGKIDAVIDGGVCACGVASTVLDMTVTPYSVLRSGAVTRTQIANALSENLTLIGITGGSGCGKTTALNTLASMGALIIDCDEVYHTLTEQSKDMRSALCEQFGDVYDGNILNRKKLGAVVFSNPDALRRLNEITHHFVNDEVERRLCEFAMCGGAVAAIDAIALPESDLRPRCAFTVAITAPVETRITRLMAREQISREYAALRISAQKPDDYFESNCDYTLKNNTTKADFEAACDKFFKERLSHG